MGACSLSGPRVRLAPTPAYTATLQDAPTGAAANPHTLRLMRQIIAREKCDPRVMQAAHSIIYTQPERDAAAEARALYEYVRDNIRYVQDVAGVETLCAPSMTLQRMIGDCDDQTMLLCALCESAGYWTRLVMAQYQAPDFEHVYCQVLVNGLWVNCDPIEREGWFGWAPPDPRRLFIESV